MRCVLTALMVGGALLASGCQDAPGPTVVIEPSVDPALSRAAALASVCSGCHMDGSDHQGLVSLDGLTADAIAISMLAYRNDDTRQTVMNRLARGYSPADIELIAEYLAGEMEQ